MGRGLSGAGGRDTEVCQSHTVPGVVPRLLGTVTRAELFADIGAWQTARDVCGLRRLGSAGEGKGRRLGTEALCVICQRGVGDRPVGRSPAILQPRVNP